MISGKSIRILLVEDTPSDVRLIREALKSAPVPVQITIAVDGVEAMEYLNKVKDGQVSRPDLVLLDWNLPRMNGREVLAQVKVDPELKLIPIVVMTTSKEDDDIAQAYRLNANCYITKPSDLSEYENVVQAIENFWFLTASLPTPFPRLAPELYQAAPPALR